VTDSVIDTASGGPAAFDSAEALAAIADATRHLLDTVADLSDDDMRAPSRCDGWTRGHVVTHLARNGDGTANMLNTASTGEVTPMYASNEKRAADIEAGAYRSAAELKADLRESAERWDAAFARVAAAQWDTPVYRTPGAEPFPVWQVPAMRLREVLIHHVDLDLDFTPAHWPEDFADESLAVTLERFRAKEGVAPFRIDVEEDDAQFGIGAEDDDDSVLIVRGPKRALLAWLMGRASGDGLVAELPEGGRGPLPTLPSWG
jgi:maleylpyruvate isomerase